MQYERKEESTISQGDPVVHLIVYPLTLLGAAVQHPAVPHSTTTALNSIVLGFFFCVLDLSNGFLGLS